MSLLSTLGKVGGFIGKVAGVLENPIGAGVTALQGLGAMLGGPKAAQPAAPAPMLPQGVIAGPSPLPMTAPRGFDFGAGVNLGGPGGFTVGGGVNIGGPGAVTVGGAYTNSNPPGFTQQSIAPGAGGACPRGYHLNRHALPACKHHPAVPARSLCVRNRHSNPLNGRAARRALRRLKRADKMTRKIHNLFHRRPAAHGGRGKGGRFR